MHLKVPLTMIASRPQSASHSSMLQWTKTRLETNSEIQAENISFPLKLFHEISAHYMSPKFNFMIRSELIISCEVLGPKQH